MTTGRVSAVLAAIFLVLAFAAGAMAQAPARAFLEPLVTEDADPSNELELAPGWNRESHSSDFNFAFSIEKQLSPQISVEIGDAINTFSRRRAVTSEGLDNLEILPKWAFFTSDEHEFRIALGADLFPSTGDDAAGAETHTRGGPLLLWRKGMGDLADRGVLHYLRPLAIQSDMGYLPTWGGPESGEFVFNAEFEYSLPYLAASGERFPLHPLTSKLVPFIEFNYLQVAIGRKSSAPPDFRLTPGLAYLTDYYQLTLGTQVAISRAASRQDQAAVLGLVDVFLDQMIPAFGWSPL